MSEDALKPTEADAQRPPVQLLGQFIKDLSFEVPGAPEIYSHMRQNPPELPISLDASMRHLSGGTYEVTLSVNIEATAGGRPAFIFEIAYGCLVEINETIVPNEAIHPLLLIEVPRQIFPFVRQIIADMTVNGGFPPLLLQMVDFATLYNAKYGVSGQPVDERPADAPLN